jgi:rRNA maturation endonuclease Nob1
MKFKLKEIAENYGIHINTVRNWKLNRPAVYEALVLGMKRKRFCVDCGVLTVEDHKNAG